MVPSRPSLRLFFVTCGLQCDAAVGYFIYSMLIGFRGSIRNHLLDKNLTKISCIVKFCAFYLLIIKIIPLIDKSYLFKIRL